MPEFSTILALDSAMNGCGACIYKPQDGTYFTEKQAMDRGQSEQLMPMIERVRAQAGAAYADLGAVVVTVGPGAFTGLRIGLSAARSLGLALDIPVYGITTLQALALECIARDKPAEEIVALIETKRQDFYWQVFTPDGTEITEPAAATAEKIAQARLTKASLWIGDALTRFQQEVSTNSEHWRFATGYDLPCPRTMAQALAKGCGILEETAPIYLRMPDVSTSKKPQRTIQNQI